MSLSRYRAWDKENSRMVYPSTDDVYFVLTDDGINILDMSVEPFDDVFPRLDAVLMQSTGLKDKKGVEIYEGDIVQSTWYDVDNNPYKKKGEITFVGAQYVIVYDSQFDVETGEITYDAHSLTYAEDVEVIGNIYEQPELLSNP